MSEMHNYNNFFVNGSADGPEFDYINVSTIRKQEKYRINILTIIKNYYKIIDNSTREGSKKN